MIFYYLMNELGEYLAHDDVRANSEDLARTWDLISDASAYARKLGGNWKVCSTY